MRLSNCYRLFLFNSWVCNKRLSDKNFDVYFFRLNLTLNVPQKREIKVAMSNTFGFGGHNACVLFKKLEE